MRRDVREDREPAADPRRGSNAAAPETDVAALLRLQATAGNVAVGRMLAAGPVVARQQANPPPQFTPADAGRQQPTAAQPATPAGQAATPGGGGGQPANAQWPEEDFVFLMGEDAANTTNPFYTQADAYFRRTVPRAHFDADQRTLEGVLNILRARQVRARHVYIVTHAHPDGTLQFGLNSADQDPTTITFTEMRDAVRQNVLPQLSGQVTPSTRIHIRGCNIGRSQEFVNLVDEVFGGEGVVTAPTHEQRYGGTSGESLSGYFVERPGDVTLTPAQLLTEFRAKYPWVPERTLRQLLRGVTRRFDEYGGEQEFFNGLLPETPAQARAAAGQMLPSGSTLSGEPVLTRTVNGDEETYSWSLPVQGASPTVWEQQVRTEASIRREIEGELPRQNAYEVTAARIRTGANLRLVGRARRTEYVIRHQEMIDEQGRPLQPPESDRRWYGESTYQPPPPPPAPPPQVRPQPAGRS